MSYAVIQTGGKQYRVEENDILDIEKLDGDEGATVTFEVLARSAGGALTVGTPLISGATVTGEIVDQFRAKKIIAYKKKRRKGYERKVGHRQSLTKVKITSL